MASMKLLFSILSIIIFTIMAKAQVTFQGKFLYDLITGHGRLTGPEFQDLQKVVFDWADSYDSKVRLYMLSLSISILIE